MSSAGHSNMEFWQNVSTSLTVGSGEKIPFILGMICGNQNGKQLQEF